MGVASLPTVADEIARLAERVSRSVVQVQCRNGGGSGVIWHPDGLLITNAHVMQRRKATITLWDGRELKARLCAYDAQRDLAALRVDGENLAAAHAGDVRSLRVGQMVFALGNPHGSDRALSAGVIHTIGPVDGRHRQTWVQADLTLHPGNSGGPLFDSSGAVIGINSMIAYGLALAVPVWAVKDLIGPSVPRPRLGIQCEPVRLPERNVVNLMLTSGDGLLIVSVADGSPAESAGFMIGDVISGVAAKGQTPAAPFQLERLLSNATNGDALTLEIVRAGKRELRDVVCDSLSPAHTEAA